MNLKLDNEFFRICQIIKKENKKEPEWALIESPDMYQTNHYCGGYDATEMAFCFSYYNEKNKEFWFQLTLEEVEKIINLKKKYIEISPLR